MIYTGTTRTYVVYELPGPLACGTCGHALLVHQGRGVYPFGQGCVEVECTNPRCADKGIEVKTDVKRHEYEVKK